jgi:hypothetical protein
MQHLHDVPVTNPRGPCYRAAGPRDGKIRRVRCLQRPAMAPTPRYPRSEPSILSSGYSYRPDPSKRIIFHATLVKALSITGDLNLEPHVGTQRPVAYLYRTVACSHIRWVLARRNMPHH